MKTKKTFIVIFVLLAIIASPISSFAWWAYDGSVVEVQRFVPQANLVINVDGNLITAKIAEANENQIIAMALTAMSINALVHVSINSGEIVGIRVEAMP